ncbi:MAG: guanylate kinase [Clostridiales Family XIII bacterium]|jgi:guanylate kinase|nr:guanylate kinase [Clostridiales Family XIII bacterium]
MVREGLLFVVSGPSGVGKGTVCGELVKRVDISLSVSMTTRKPRPGEIDGRDYHFVSEELFLKTVSDGGFFEYAKVYDRYYGTPKDPVTARLAAGEDVLLEIDTQGALKVKREWPGGIFIYILPPSMRELRRRITDRGAETQAAIDLRLGESLKEMARIDQYDYCVINERADETADRLAAIRTAERARVGRDIHEIIRTYKEELQCYTHPSI